ncbi:MAG: hypothetical protein FWG13_07945 [Leptospirales bacterium]|nr:hypothetical protein [Leptospirales bacterium]
MSKDYIPQNAAQFNSFMANLLAYVQERTDKDNPVWPDIPAARVTSLAAAFAVFQTAFEATQGQHTPAQTLARREAQAECTKELRGFVNQYLRFPPVTNVDRLAMGVNNHDSIRTDHTVVTEKVDYVIHLRGIRELVVNFWVQGADNKAKPDGYDGAVVIWDIRDTAPQRFEDLTHHAMASRTPFILHFEEADRGKTAYIALVWQNERGILGEYSEIKSAIIP